MDWDTHINRNLSVLSMTSSVFWICASDFTYRLGQRLHCYPVTNFASVFAILTVLTILSCVFSFPLPVHLGSQSSALLLPLRSSPLAISWVRARDPTPSPMCAGTVTRTSLCLITSTWTRYSWCLPLASPQLLDRLFQICHLFCPAQLI